MKKTFLSAYEAGLWGGVEVGKAESRLQQQDGAMTGLGESSTPVERQQSFSTHGSATNHNHIAPDVKRGRVILQKTHRPTGCAILYLCTRMRAGCSNYRLFTHAAILVPPQRQIEVIRGSAEGDGSQRRRPIPSD